jgi:glycosyltransferase involved in cell wall biosynthesis
VGLRAGCVSDLRILFACPYPPSFTALAGGPKEAARVMHGLSVLDDVRCLCLRADPETGTGEELDAAGVIVEEIDRGPVERSAPVRLVRSRRVLGGWAVGRPRAVSALASRRFARRLSELDREWLPDVVHFEHLYMAYYLDAVRRPVPRVIRMLEPAAATAREVALRRRGLQKAASRFDARLTARFERRALGVADGIVVLTEGDRDVLSDTHQADLPMFVSGLTFVVPNQANEPHRADDRTVAFVGNFTHAPNAHAAETLARRILPALQLRVEGARLLLIGEGSESVSRDTRGVVATGRVHDIADSLEAAAVVAIPIRTGGGMRVKAFEALALGKAVVATPLAVAGLPTVDGQHLLLAESDEDFADAIAALLVDRPRRLALGAAAREWAVAQAAETSAARQLHAYYAELVAARQRRGRL